MAACANITANIRDYNRSPDQLDIDERTNSSKSRKSNSASATATPEKQRDKAAPAASKGEAKLGSNKKSKEDTRPTKQKSKSKNPKKKPKPKSKKRKNTAYDSDDSYEASSSESSEPNISSDEEEEEEQPPPITGPAVTVGTLNLDQIAKFSYPISFLHNFFSAVTLPARKSGSSRTTTAASSLSTETTTTASSTVPPITGQQNKLGYRGITVEEQTALVEAEIARRRKAAMELAAKSRLAYQQNYAATTGPVSLSLRPTSSMLQDEIQVCPPDPRKPDLQKSIIRKLVTTQDTSMDTRSLGGKVNLPTITAFIIYYGDQFLSFRVSYPCSRYLRYCLFSPEVVYINLSGTIQSCSKKPLLVA